MKGLQHRLAAMAVLSVLVFCNWVLFPLPKLNDGNAGHVKLFVVISSLISGVALSSLLPVRGDQAEKESMFPSRVLWFLNGILNVPYLLVGIPVICVVPRISELAAFYLFLGAQDVEPFVSVGLMGVGVCLMAMRSARSSASHWLGVSISAASLGKWYFVSKFGPLMTVVP